jgi:hypothetical protein
MYFFSWKTSQSRQEYNVIPYYEFVKAKKGEKAILQSRVAWDRSCCGLGVRAVRAGSIGWDRQRFGENTESPQSNAGGLGPRPLYEEISAL